MSGAAGPSVTLHVPFSPRVISLRPANCTSTSTVFAESFLYSKVTVPSAFCRGCALATAHMPTSAIDSNIFFITLVVGYDGKYTTFSVSLQLFVYHFLSLV